MFLRRISMSGYAEKIRWLEDMYPGYFTLTMATGIIGVALHLLDIKVLSNLIYWATLVSWGAIFVLYICRLIYFPKAVFDDLMNPRKTFSFFSFVAATNVSGLLLHIHGQNWRFFAGCWHSCLGQCCFTAASVF